MKDSLFFPKFAKKVETTAQAFEVKQDTHLDTNYDSYEVVGASVSFFFKDKILSDDFETLLPLINFAQKALYTSVRTFGDLICVDMQ